MKTLAGIDDDLPEVYQRFEVPINIRDLKKLYAYFNKEYFGNNLPGNLDISIKKDSKFPKALGVASFTMQGDKLLSQTLTISPVLKNIRPVNNTLLHEMIHIKNQLIFVATGDQDILDSIISKEDKKQGHIKGHGKHFTKEMNRINAKGFSVNRTSDVGSFIEMEPAWVILFKTESESFYGVYSVKPVTDIDDIVDQVVAKIGQGIITNYSIYKTDDPHMLQLPKITAKGKVPKKRMGRYAPTAFRNIREGTPVKKDVAIKQDIGDIPEDIKTTIVALSKNFRSDTFTNFLVGLFGNTKGYETYVSEFNNFSYKYGDRVPTGLTDVIDFAYANWENVGDAEIKRSPWFKSLVLDSFDSMLKEDSFYHKGLSNHVGIIYNKYLDSRYDKKKFNKILLKAVTDMTNNMFKKPGMEILVEKYFGVAYVGVPITKKIIMEVLMDRLDNKPLLASTIKVIKTTAADQMFNPDLDDPRLNNLYMKDDDLEKNELRDVDEYDADLESLDQFDDNNGEIDGEDYNVVDLRDGTSLEEETGDDEDEGRKVIRKTGRIYLGDQDY